MSFSEPQSAGSIRFDGKVALITGAGSGLGRVYAREFAARGAMVVVNDFGGARDGDGAGDKTPADCVVEEIVAQGGSAVANYDSVAEPEGGRAMVDTAVRAFGKLDILVNNAGILRDKTLLKTEPADWGAVIAVHLTGAYNVTRPAFVAMREHQYGRIICATSAAGLYGNFGQCNYSAAKLGLVGFMNTLKLEGKKFGILANAVAPIAATRMTEDVFPPDFMETLKPEHIAPLVLFLGSEQCDVSGMIFNAGMGRFGRAAIMTAPGVILSEGRPSQPEDIAARFEEIMSLDGAEEFHDAQQALGSWLSPTR